MSTTRTYRLTPERSALWELGGWDAFLIEEDICTWLQEEEITDTIIVVLDDGSVACTLTYGEGL
jgi:hypothetical protein